MRAPSARMFPHTIEVYRKTGTDTGDGNMPLGPWVLVVVVKGRAVSLDTEERQIFQVIDTPITFRVRFGGDGSYVTEGDRLVLPGGETVLVAQIRNTHEFGVVYVAECYDDPA